MNKYSLWLLPLVILDFVMVIRSYLDENYYWLIYFLALGMMKSALIVFAIKKEAKVKDDLYFPDLFICTNCNGKGEFESDMLDKASYKQWEIISRKSNVIKTPKGTCWCVVCDGSGKPKEIKLELEN